jgi:accessory gene regulator B
MIQLLADKTARFIAAGDENADIEVLTYGYYMFYQQWITLIAILLIALPFGLFFLVLASLVTSMTLRGCTGGTHAAHPIICKLSAFAIAFTPSVLAGVFSLKLLPVGFAVFYLLSVVLLVIYAPADTDVRKITNPRKRKRMKIESLIWLSVFFSAAVFLQGRLPSIAFVVAVTAFISCCLVHPIAYWLFGFDPKTKEARKPRW